MTFRLVFFAEQAFLSQTKLLLEQDHGEKQYEVSAMCILACASALEAYCNSLLLNVLNLPEFERKPIKDKIKKVLDSRGVIHPLKREPWQTLMHMYRVRNWLAHYKNCDIGLLDSDGQWIQDGANSAPEFDPRIELAKERAQEYYRLTRQAMKEMALSLNREYYEFEYLDSEIYEPFLFG